MKRFCADERIEGYVSDLEMLSISAENVSSWLDLVEQLQHTCQFHFDKVSVGHRVSLSRYHDVLLACS